MHRNGLEALRRKYAAIRRMREGAAEADPELAKVEMRVLAGEFPGALRELDRLELPLVCSRVAELERALVSGIAEPWMEQMVAFHSELRVALALKRIVGKCRQAGVGGDPAAADLETACRLVTQELDQDCPIDLAQDVVVCEDGRLSQRVIARVARAAGVTPLEVEDNLFPDENSGSRRRGRPGQGGG